jgi:Thiol-activated cytolysin/FG-GAP-like repeat
MRKAHGYTALLSIRDWRLEWAIPRLGASIREPTTLPILISEHAMPRRLPHGLGIWVSITALALIACGESAVQVNPEPDPDPDPDPGQAAAVNNYLTGLPSWAAFSPPGAAQAITATGDSTLLPDETVLNVTDFSQGDGELVPAIRYMCQTRPYTMSENPQEIVMYSPDKDILWPGGLIQGASHRDGLGALLSLPIGQRSALQVSIPSLSTADNFRTVESPTQATVSSAIGSMIGAATASGLSTPSTISFEQTVYHSEEQFALSIGVSGSYMGFSSSASGSFSRDASETTVTAHFLQKMYEVVVAPPQTPGAFFATDFTEAVLQQQIDLGRLGPDNVPIYVANVVYGRMMAFSFTSSASETDIRATLKAAYDGIGSSASLSLSTRQRKILEESKIRVASLGGDAQATIDVIRSGDWTQYFTDVAPLSSAEPLSYTFRHLEGEVAGVTESTDFAIKTCSPRPPTGATFEFLLPQMGAAPIGTPFETYVGDFDGDGSDDLMMNYRGASLNELSVQLSNGNGTFTEQAVATHPAQPSQGWPNYEVLVGDVDADGLDDIVWNFAGAVNHSYVGLSMGDGSFTFTDVRVHPVTNWGTGFDVFLADVDGQNGADIIWNEINGGSSRVFVATSDGSGDFTYLPVQPYSVRPVLGFSQITSVIADMNGDTQADIVLNSLTGVCFANTCRQTYVGLGQPNGTMSWLPPTGDARSWNSNYLSRVGNVNQDSRGDLVINAPNLSQRQIIVLANDGTGVISPLPDQFVAAATLDNESDAMTTHLMDVDGNGIKDIVWRTTTSNNRLYVGLGTNGGVFDFSRTNQEHPEANDWATYRALVGDINGDGRDDLIWTNEASSNSVFVALAIVR